MHSRPATQLRALAPALPVAVHASLRRELAEELGAQLAGDARLVPLGVATDLRRLRPEVCLRLDLESWGGPPVDSREFSAFEVVPLRTGALERFWSAHPPTELTPAGAGTIALLELAGLA